MSSITKYGLALLLLILSISVSAQDSLRVRKAIIVEYGGPGLQYSVNADMMLSNPICGTWAITAGVGGKSLDATIMDSIDTMIDFLSFPVGINYLVGKYKNFLEAGLILTPILSDFEGEVGNDFFRTSGLSFAVFGNLGYRYQSFGNGLFLRLSWNPVINQGGFTFGKVGIGAGISFR